MPGNVRYSQGSYNGSQGTHNGEPGKSLPSRSLSVESLTDKGPMQEYVPTRISRLGPKVNTNAAMQFVKAGPAALYKTANDQIKKAETVKALRKQMTVEEEDWQEQPSSSHSSKPGPYDEDTDWQSNLDKWKSSRRKRNEDALDRVLEIKKNEEDEQFNKTRRKSKTFNEMQEDKTKRGRRYNLVVHDDDNSDLSELGLGLPSEDDKGTTSINDIQDENDHKELDNDNKDAKSDAGFCTGSDTGSDGVFAEDNISDTSSALGDKKEAHDSLLDPGVSKEDELHMNGHNLSLTSSSITSSFSNSTLITKDKESPDEYTYDKAIEGYKQFAVNSVKRRTPSITSLNSNASFASSSTKEDEKERSQINTRAPSPSKGKGLEDKLSFFTKEMEKDFETSPKQPNIVVMREKEKPKIDVGKRRSMFELGDVSSLQNSNNSTTNTSSQEQKHLTRRPSDIAVPGSLKNRVKSFENLDSDNNRPRSITPQRDTKLYESFNYSTSNSTIQEQKPLIRRASDIAVPGSLKNRVKSFENLDSDINRPRSITPQRDAKFHEKLASFSHHESETELKQSVRKNTPERDMNFHKKLASFTNINNDEEDKILERKPPTRRDSTTLRNKIASFEHLDQTEESHVSAQFKDETLKSFDRSVSLEHLIEEPKNKTAMRSAVSTGNVMRRIHSTPYMVVDLDSTVEVEEEVKICNENVVNAQVFELASKLEETPLIGSPTDKTETLVSDSTTVSSLVSTQPSDLLSEPNLYQQTSQTNTNFIETLSHTQSHNTQSTITSSFTQDMVSVAQNNSIEIKSVTFKEDANVLAENDVSSNVTNNNYDHQDHDDSFEYGMPYTDEDINEVISDYEQVDGQNGNGNLVENIYENITDEYMYENIYEKVGGDNSGEINSPADTFINNEPHYHTLTTEIEHQYQTLDEVRSEVQKIEESSIQQKTSNINILPQVNQQKYENEFIPPPANQQTFANQQSFVSQQAFENQQTFTNHPTFVNQPTFANQTTFANQETFAVSAAPEVLDVTWTDGPSQVAPPSEPPPPPPPDDDSDDDIEHHLLAQNEDPNFTREKSTRRLKKELWRRRSDFLGTSSQYTEEETTVKPPPDLSEILRQECESERRLVESQSPRLTRIETTLEEDEIIRREREIIENLERSEKLQQQNRTKYLWEDRMRDDEGTTTDINEADEHFQYQEKLAELEEEMMRHDKGMLKKLQAATNSQQIEHIPPPTPYASLEEPPIVPPLPHISALETQQSDNYSFEPPKQLPMQEFYTAPSYEPPPPMIVNEIKVQPPATSPSQYNTLASPHPYTRSHSQSSIHPALSSVQSTPGNSPRDIVPEPLPRKTKLPPPPPEKPHHLQQYGDLDSNERQEALRLSRFSSSESSIHTEMSDTSVQSVASGQQMTKQTLLALSAIPKPRLTDNESWIKRKTENKKDYSKHWLIQEAEQRRLEDQDRIPRQKQGSQGSLVSSQQHTSLNHHSSQQISSPQHSSPQHTSPPDTSPLQHQSSNNFITQNNNQIYTNYSQSSSYSSSSNVNNSSHAANVNNNNKNWRNASKTYQPTNPSTITQPSANDKALPDSIIHNLTQRVNNKNIKNTYSNTNVRNGSYGNSSYRGDENYHDYMNSEALSAASAHAPIYQSAQPAAPTAPSQQPQTQQEQEEQDQRLLSVSGKKKCSHCGEELGRGAAMIIESLRLFYHIPCFKCCVCGIQLGNGSAGADVRVRNHKLHCHNCYSNDEGMKFSKV